MFAALRGFYAFIPIQAKKAAVRSVTYVGWNRWLTVSNPFVGWGWGRRVFIGVVFLQGGISVMKQHQSLNKLLPQS